LVVALAGQVAAVAGYGIARGNRRVVAYLVVWSLLALLIRAGHRRWPLPRATVVALAAAGALHLAGGLLPSPDQGAPILYETWLVPGVLKFDQAAHAFISAVVTVAVFQALRYLIDDDRAGGPGVRAIVAMLACWGFGAANELFEFLSALRFPDAYVGGLENTGWDLAFNTLGGLLAAIACTALGTAATRSTASARGRASATTGVAEERHLAELGGRAADGAGVPPLHRPGGGKVFAVARLADPVHVPPLGFDPLGGDVEEEVAMGGGVHPGDVGVLPADHPVQY
jgi:hypothetical protein